MRVEDEFELGCHVLRADERNHCENLQREDDFDWSARGDDLLRLDPPSRRDQSDSLSRGLERGEAGVRMAFGGAPVQLSRTCRRLERKELEVNIRITEQRSEDLIKVLEDQIVPALEHLHPDLERLVKLCARGTPA